VKTLIVDDERLARAELRRLLAMHPEVEIIGEAASVDEACELIERQRPELLLLDIRMPGGSGFDLLARLDAAPEVIFLTAYDEFALRAFAVNALDYLLKPVAAERLAEALARAQQKLAERSTPLDAAQRIFLREGERCWFLPLDEIRLFESEGNYTRLHFADGRCLTQRSLAAIEARLDATIFFRANRQQIVNLRAVRAVEVDVSGGLLLRIEGGLQALLSRRRSIDFRERMSL